MPYSVIISFRLTTKGGLALNMRPTYPYVSVKESVWNTPVFSQTSNPDIPTSLLQLGAVLLVVWGAISAGEALIDAVAKIISPPSPRRRRRRPNNQPLSQQTRMEVFSRDRGRCTYCGRRVTRSTAHIDHSVSRVNGGTNHKNNLRTACQYCNLVKGPLNARQFMRIARI
jgi:hypothetical protein